MVTFTIQLTNNNQFKKYINGLDLKLQGLDGELLYIWIKNGKCYLVNFPRNHIYVSALYLGKVPNEEDNTWQITDNYEDLKRFAKEIKADDIIHLDKVGNSFEFNNIGKDTYSTGWDSTNKITLTNLDYICSRAKHFRLKKQDFKVLDLYKSKCTRLTIQDGKILFDFYEDKKHKVIAKHILCDKYDNEEEDYVHFCNKYFLQILKKFNSNGVIDVYFDNDNPLRVEYKDFVGVVAPRILFDGDIEDL